MAGLEEAFMHDAVTLVGWIAIDPPVLAGENGLCRSMIRYRSPLSRCPRRAMAPCCNLGSKKDARLARREMTRNYAVSEGALCPKSLHDMLYFGNICINIDQYLICDARYAARPAVKGSRLTVSGPTATTL